MTQIHEGGDSGEPTIAEVTAPPATRAQKENMADFIAKKREIFLVQMSLDTKRAGKPSCNLAVSLTPILIIEF